VSRLVVKIGGSVARDSAAHVLGDDLVASSHEIVVVHGAGPQISAEMERRGLPVHFVGGRRVTSHEALEVVRESMAAVNAAVCAALGRQAIGLMGDEIGLRATLVPELGRVGDPIPSSPPAIEAALASGRVPVVAPLAAGPLNVNADEMAAALAVGLGADRLVFLTDVPGLLLGGEVVARIAADDAEELLENDVLEGGILPKLHAAVSAARSGVRADLGETAVVA
jgi:acetylglutamate kinase